VEEIKFFVFSGFAVQCGCEWVCKFCWNRSWLSEWSNMHQ